MRVFVTGGTGFIGRRLIEALLRSGAEVRGLVRREPSDLPAGARSVVGDVRSDVASLAAGLVGCEVVYHLAAAVSFDPAMRQTLLEVNGEGTRRVLDAARLAGVRRTVVVSSACTVGLSASANDVLDEDTPEDAALDERNPYLHSKRVAERHVEAAAAAGQWVTMVNPTTVFGPGDHSLNSGTMVRQVAEAKVLPVPPGGSNVVDIDDVVAGVLGAARQGQAGRRYILGGANLRFREIIDRIADVVGRRPMLVPLPAVMRWPMTAAAWAFQRVTHSRLITPQIIADTFAFKYYSSDRAERELGWRAQRSFTDTLAAACSFYRQAGLIELPRGAAA